MKLEIDFQNKTVKVLSDVTIGEIVKKLKELNLKWEDFKIIQDLKIINVPIIPDLPVYPIQPVYPVQPYYPVFPRKWEITCNTQMK